MRVKDNFHHLIDRIEDETILKSYYELIQRLNDNQSGQLWENLSPDEKQELLLSYEESFTESNLINHEEVKQQHAVWLKK